MSTLPPTNFHLDAAIAALNAQPYPWFAPAYSIRLSDPAAYGVLDEAYGAFGTGVIMGLSPQDAATLTGLPIVMATSLGLSDTWPCILVFPQALNVLGVPITVNESGGTIDISYASPYGRFDRVVWTWQAEVRFQPIAVDPGRWSQAVITYTGTGVNGRLVPTAFPLNVGRALVWIFPQVTYIASYRSNDPAMLGTVMSSSGLVDTNGGIMSFTGSGFTVQDDGLENVFVNQLGQAYTAIVISDTTVDNRYLHVGQYAGTSSAGSPANNTFDTSFSPGAPPTAVWVFGRNSVIVFCSDQFTAPFSVSFEIEMKPLNNQLLALDATCEVGSDNNVNDNTLEYYWAAFCIPVDDVVRQGFTWYRVDGAGALINVDVGFQPAFATARPFVSGVPFSVWRSPLHVGTDCTDFASVDQPTGGIVAFLSNGLTLGADAAPAATKVYGFALVASFSGNGGPQPAYNPDVLPPGAFTPSGGLVSQGLGTGQLGPCGCPLVQP